MQHEQNLPMLTEMASNPLLLVDMILVSARIMHWMFLNENHVLMKDPVIVQQSDPLRRRP
jgi:hypothetical protein